ncbi:MAG: chaperonin GroEL [Anaerolineae bacterium]|nr:chaperonin GroEL [Anaerolineae bacterium]
MKTSRTRRVVFQPATYRRMQKGIHKMVNAVSPTLGALPRLVALEPISSRTKLPEFLDDGGTIARRIIQIADRDEDMGAMFVRQMLWSLREKVGDGTATAAVLFRSLYDQGVHYITSGGNAMLLSRYLEEGLRVIVDQLSTMARPVEGKEHIAQIAESICHDPPLARLLGEIFDIIGEHGRLEIRSGRGRALEREYVEGMYWDNSGVHARQMLDPSTLRVELENAYIMISDFELEDPYQLMPLLRKAVEARASPLVLVASKLSDRCVGLLLAASKDPSKFHVIAVKVPGLQSYDRSAALEDMAILTGGKYYTRVAGQSVTQVQLDDLGRARRAWADRFNFGIVGGKGDPRVLRRHIADLRLAFSRVEDKNDRKNIQKRIGKLLGGSATLYVGGLSEIDVNARKELAERTAEAVRGVISEGVVPGGGVALLSCKPVLQQIAAESTEVDRRAAYRILARAMEEPMRTIIRNAGHDASEIMAEIKLAGPGYGFDVRSGKVVNMAEAGIFDALSVQKEAVHSAVSSAALALTIDVLVHRKNPPQAVNP